MTQLPLFLLLHVLGLAIGVLVGPRDRPQVLGAIGLLVGFATLIAIELLCLGCRVPFSPLTGGGLAGVVIVTTTIAAVRRHWLARRAWQILGCWTAGMILVGVLVTRVDLATMTYDSHYLVMMGGAIARDGAIAPGMMAMLGDYGIFEVLAHGLLRFTGESYLWALAPMVGASTMVAFAVLLREGLRALGVHSRWSWVAVVGLTMATFSIYMVLRHVFYIQTNFGTMSYLLLYCALFWLAEATDDPRWLPLGFVALFGVALHRIEGPLICALFLALTVLPSRLPTRAMLRPLLVVAGMVACWFLLAASQASPASEFLTPTRCYAMASVLPVICGYVWLTSSGPFTPLQRLNAHAPALIAIGMTAGLGLAFALRTDHMIASARGWGACLLRAPYWIGAWPVIIVLGLLGLALPAPRGRWPFVVGVPAYLALVLLLVLTRTPYYVGMGDSAARMAIHPVPLAFFYVGLKFVPWLTPRRSEAHADEPAR